MSQIVQIAFEHTGIDQRKKEEVIEGL